MNNEMTQHFITLWRVMVAGTRNFFRNAWLSVAATAVMAVTLTVMLMATALNFALNDTLEQVTKKIDITIFFKDQATRSQVSTVEQELQKISNVQTVKYVTKVDALERYRQQNKDNPVLLAAINEKENPLPQSLEIQVKDLNHVEPINEVTRRSDFSNLIQGTNSSDERQKTIERIGGINSFLTKAGLLASLLFAVIAILIIFNTIRIAIFSRGEELQIMRLIGATNSFIRGPFIFEAMLDGIVAAIVSLVIVYILLFYGAQRYLGYADFSHTLALFGNNWTLVGIITIISGMMIGTFSSLLAMIRYLKL